MCESFSQIWENRYIFVVQWHQNKNGMEVLEDIEGKSGKSEQGKVKGTQDIYIREGWRESKNGTVL